MSKACCPENEILSVTWVREATRVAAGLLTGIGFLTSEPGSLVEYGFGTASAVLLGWTAFESVLRQLRKGKISINLLMILGGGGPLLLAQVRDGILLLFLFSLCPP